MSILFREHRGSLADSMETVIEVSSINDIIAYCVMNGYIGITDPKSVIIKKYGDDIATKCGWDTHIVMYPRHGVLGFTNGEIK